MTYQISVLNASYEVLGSTKLGRAINLVSSGRAVVEESHENRFVRSVGGIKIPLPKVIRLLTYIRVPFHYSEEYWSKQGVIRRDNKKCAFCGKSGSTVDHLVPRSRFTNRQDADTWMNTVCSCYACNSKKADRTPEEALMVLLYDPWIPMRIYYNSGKTHKKAK